MPDCARHTPLAHPRARKTIPIATRLLPAAIAEIEAAACSAGIRRHRVLQAIFRLGTPLAIAELAASAAAPSTKEE